VGGEDSVAGLTASDAPAVEDDEDDGALGVVRHEGECTGRGKGEREEGRAKRKGDGRRGLTKAVAG
jgi:hypothetical protein